MPAGEPEWRDPSADVGLSRRGHRQPSAWRIRVALRRGRLPRCADSVGPDVGMRHVWDKRMLKSRWRWRGRGGRLPAPRRLALPGLPGAQPVLGVGVRGDSTEGSGGPIRYLRGADVVDQPVRQRFPSVSDSVRLSYRPRWHRPAVRWHARDAPGTTSRSWWCWRLPASTASGVRSRRTLGCATQIE